jgi:hypothetical protein
MRRHLQRLPLLLTAFLLLGAVAATVPPATPRMRARDDLPALARELLVERMGDHRASMSALTWAVVLLDRAAAAELASELASSPRLARTDPANGDLNGLLPPRFFELQDELHARAADLAKAAGGSDDAALARSYGRLSETCVACHSVYLNPSR